MEGDFPAALDSQVAIPKGQCVAARNNDHKTTAALKTQSSSSDRSESGWTSLLDKKPPQLKGTPRVYCRISFPSGLKGFKQFPF